MNLQHDCPGQSCTLCQPKSLAHPAWPYTGTPWEWRIQGCICPPTSEQTCKNDKCPRNPLDFRD